MGIELMDNRCFSMIRTSINQCLSVHILQYGWLEALPLLFIWVIYISGLWWLWFKYTWQESFSTYSENPVKRNNCQGSGCWIGKLWVILILLRLFGWQPSFATPCVAQPQLVAWKSSATECGEFCLCRNRGCLSWLVNQTTDKSCLAATHVSGVRAANQTALIRVTLLQSTQISP